MNTSPPQIHLRSHPPERGRHAPMTAYSGCCCCCCCCCLHTLGGLIGASFAPNKGAPTAPYPEFRPPVLEPRQARLSPPPIEETGIELGQEGMVEGLPSSLPVPQFDEDQFDLRQPGRLSAIALYWYLSLALVVLVLGIAPILYGAEAILGAVCLLAIFFPAGQLACAAVTFMVLIVSSRADMAYQLNQLGRITAGLIVGTLIGLGAMAMFLVALR